VFADLFEGGWDLLKAVHGESIVVAPAGTPAPAITAVVKRGAVLDRRFADGAQKHSLAVVLVETADVSGWTPGPTEATGDTLTFDGLTHAVLEVKQRTGGRVALQTLAAAVERFGGDESIPRR